ncbi:hypothetical protein Tco_0401001 [Tanacetum coccineum]
MSTPVFLDPEISTQANGAQSSRVPAPFPEDPYEAIRQACLVETDTDTPLTCRAKESKDSDTSGARSTTACMTVHAQPVMSPCHSAKVTKEMTLSDSAFRKRYRSSYETPPPSPTLPVWKRYKGTSEPMLDTNSEEDEIGEDDTDKDGEDKSLDMDDEGDRLDSEDRGIEGEGLSLEEEAVPEGQQQAALVVETAASETFRLGYGALRRRELAVEEDQIHNPEDGRTYIDVPTYPLPAPPVQTWPSPEWSSGSLPVSPAHSNVPSPIPSPIASPVATPTATILVDKDQFIEIGAQLELYGGILQDHTQRLDAMPPTLFAEIDRDVRELYTRSGEVRDEIFSQRYRLRSLEHEQERIVMTFGALWRTVLALEAWAGRVDTRLADTSRDRYDDHRLIRDMLVQHAAMQHELQEKRGRVTALEQERDHREWSLGESEETPLEETNSLEGQCIELGNGISLWMIVVWYVIGVVTLRALVRAGDKTSEDARSWYMISGDAKSWDPYEAIRQTYLVETDTESEPFEGPAETKTPESPHIVASPTLLPDSTPPTCRAEESEDFVTSGARSTSSDSTAPLVTEMMALSYLAFCKRYRSSYETPPPSPTLLVRKRYRGTSEPMVDTDSEEDKIGEEDIDEDGEDESLDVDDEEDRSDSEDRGIEGEGLGLEEEVVLEGQQQAASVVETVASEPLGLGYEALRRRELAVKEDHIHSMFEVGQGSGSVPEPERAKRVSALRQPTLTTWIDPEDGRTNIDVPAYPAPSSPVQTPPSPELSSGSLPISPAPSTIPSPIPSLLASPVATLTTTILVDEDPFIEIGAQSRALRDEIFSQRYRLRSLEHEQERTTVTFEALWRPVLALEAWAGRVDTRLVDTSRDRYDNHRLIRDILVQQAAMQHELQEMIGRVTALEQERDHREW